MLLKLLKIIVLVVLVLMPFLSAALWLGKFSPYFDGNSLGIYITLSIVNSLVYLLLLLPIINKYLPKQLLFTGILLFCIGIVMASVAGLVSPPDFSVAMLKHPEREHFRYVLLFLGALLFIGAIIFFRQPEFGKLNILLLVCFIPAIAELLWEFYHHYFFAENLKAWIDSGNNADKFMDHYSGVAVIKLGTVGRFFQYSCIALLTYLLKKYTYIRKWSLAILFLLCGIGIFVAVFIFFYGFNFTGPYQAFMFFFIPAGPFLLLYWLGIALLTKPSVK
jgi:hypothetical protein